jgi:ABC-type uncharacterized transport system auxiliary subunit
VTKQDKQQDKLPRRWVHGWVLLCAALLSGCGGEVETQLEDYLVELEFDRPMESVKEIKVNSYRFPCAASLRDEAGADLPPMWVQMKFDLYVVVAEEDEEAVLAAIKRHQGMLDDTVMSVCRKSSIEQLQDSRWASLKSQLIEAVRPLLGEKRVRQLTFIYTAPWEPI